MVTSVARATRPLEGGAPLRLGRLLAAVGGNAPADWRALFGYDLPEGVLIVGGLVNVEASLPSKASCAWTVLCAPVSCIYFSLSLRLGAPSSLGLLATIFYQEKTHEADREVGRLGSHRTGALLVGGEGWWLLAHGGEEEEEHWLRA